MSANEMTEDELFLDNDEQVESDPVVEEVAPVEPEPIQAQDTGDTVQEPVEVAPVVEETPEVVEPDQSESNVPSWRLREVTEARQAAEAATAAAQQQMQQMQHQLGQLQSQLASQQPKPEVPDVFENPQGYQDFQNEQLQRSNIENNARFAKLEAGQIHGREKVSEAWQAAVQAEATNPGLTQRIGNAPNPWLEAVAWHEEVTTRQAIGDGGLEGYKARLQEEMLADPIVRQQMLDTLRAEAGQTVVGKQIPTIPSLNGAGGIRPNEQQLASSEEELFNL